MFGTREAELATAGRTVTGLPDAMRGLCCPSRIRSSAGDSNRSLRPELIAMEADRGAHVGDVLDGVDGGGSHCLSPVILESVSECDAPHDSRLPDSLRAYFGSSRPLRQEKKARRRATPRGAYARIGRPPRTVRDSMAGLIFSVFGTSMAGRRSRKVWKYRSTNVPGEYAFGTEYVAGRLHAG